MTQHNLLDPDEALRLVQAHGSLRAAAKASSWTYHQIRNAVLRADKVPEDIDPQEDEQATLERRLKDEVRRLNREVESLRKEQDDAARIRERIYELADTPITAPTWVHEPSKPGVPGIPMTLWSDWHWGERVIKAQTGGANEFDSAIAHTRAERLVQTIIDLCFDHMVNPVYPGIILNLGGDMISGLIHEELRNTNDQETFPACHDVQDVLAAGIRLLADHFGKVFVPCVPGNHGRNTIKPVYKNRVYTSFEWNIYCQLEREFRDDPRVKFMVPNEPDAYYQVYNKRFFLTHGDSLGVKGGDGIIGAIGPIMRGSIKVGRSEAQIGRDFDTILMGHWHQHLVLPGIKVNGALKGYDEFARLALRVPYQPASQQLWFVNSKHGETAHWQVYLQGDTKPTTSWVSWPEAA